MDIFSNEETNISKIYTVTMYESSLKNTPNPISYSAKLPTYELIYNISGEATIRFNGVEMLDRPGTVRYLPKGAEDNEYTVISKSDVKCIDIYFNTPDTMPMVPAIANIPELENLFIKIYNIWLSKKPNYYIDSMTVLYEIIKTIKNNSKKYISKGQTEKISLAHKYMIEHYKDKNFDYEALCNQTGLSYSYFKELFIAKYKLPPVKYLTALRINYAKNLLITSRYTVGEISEMCGFENVYYFSTVFKKHTGVSPTTYIKNPDNI